MPNTTQNPDKYPISRYLNIHSAYFPAFTRDGTQLAFLSNTTGVPQVWRVGLSHDLAEALWPDQLTFEADRVWEVYGSPASGDNRLIYGCDVGGDENIQLYLLYPDERREVSLTAGYEHVLHMFGAWSQDGGAPCPDGRCLAAWGR